MLRLIGPADSLHSSHCAALKALVAYLSVALPRSPRELVFPDTTIGPLPAIHLSTRVFADAAKNAGLAVYPSAFVDPDGVIQRIMREGTYTYTQDNIVEYHEVVEGHGG